MWKAGDRKHPEAVRFSSHESVRCRDCGESLGLLPNRRSGQSSSAAVSTMRARCRNQFNPGGQGRWMKICVHCGLTNYYDLSDPPEPAGDSREQFCAA